MKADGQVKILLLAIAFFLALIALRPYGSPTAAHADSSGSVYIEPGVWMLRAADGTKQVLGKVVVDLRTGNVWGFPTLQQDPYPSSLTSGKVQTSHPMLLGKYALDELER